MKEKYYTLPWHTILTVISLFLVLVQTTVTTNWLYASWERRQALNEVVQIEKNIRTLLRKRLHEPGQVRLEDQFVQLLMISQEPELKRLVLLRQYTWMLVVAGKPANLIRLNAINMATHPLENALRPLVYSVNLPALHNKFEETRRTQLAAKQKVSRRQFLSYVNQQIEKQIADYQQEYTRAFWFNLVFGLILLAASAITLFYMRKKLLRKLDALECMLNTAKEAILVLDAKGTITFANQSACELFAYPESMLLGMKARQLLDVNKDISLLLCAAEQENTPLIFAEGITQHNEHLPLSLSFSKDPKPYPQWWMLIIRNEQQRVKQEKHLTESINLLSAVFKVESMLLSRQSRANIYEQLCAP